MAISRNLVGAESGGVGETMPQASFRASRQTAQQIALPRGGNASAFSYTSI